MQLIGMLYGISVISQSLPLKSQLLQLLLL